MPSIFSSPPTDGRWCESLVTLPSILYHRAKSHDSSQIKESIAAGVIVILDRYYYSGCVYSAAKHLPGLHLYWARCPEIGLPRPDLCIFLDLDPEVAAERGGFGEEKYEKVEVQRRVRELFGELRGGFWTEEMVVVDAAGDVEQVHHRVLEIARDRIRRVGKGEFGSELRKVT